MDLNQLLRLHQIAKMGKAGAQTRARRTAYGDQMFLLAARIRDLRQAAGADVQSAAPFVAGEPIAAYRDR